MFSGLFIILINKSTFIAPLLYVKQVYVKYMLFLIII